MANKSSNQLALEAVDAALVQIDAIRNLSVAFPKGDTLSQAKYNFTLAHNRYTKLVAQEQPH